MKVTRKMNNWIDSRLPRAARRLLFAFGAVLGLFAVAAVTTVVTLNQIRRAQAAVSELDRARHAGHAVAAAIREQYIHQAHTLIEWNTLHIAHYDRAARIASERAMGLQKLALNADERRLAATIRQAVQSSDATFRTHVVGLIASDDHADASALNQQLEEITSQVVDSSDALNRLLEARSQAVRDGAQALHTRSRWLVLCCFGLALAIGLGLAVLHVRSIARTLNALRRGVAGLTKGDLATRIGLRGDDEFADLARLFDNMAGELQEQQARVLRAKTLASLGQMAAAIAHEINNPLSVILGYVMLMQRETGEVNVRELEIIEREARQCQAIVQDLLDFARPLKLDSTLVDIGELTREVVARQRELGRLARIRVDEAIPAGKVVVSGDEQRLRQVWINILTNAAEAMLEGGTLAVTAAIGDGVTRIRIADTGVGITAENLSHVSDPFFSTKPSGTGLGLAVCQAIMEAHNGTLEIEAAPGRGTVVTLTFPNATVPSAGA